MERYIMQIKVVAFALSVSGFLSGLFVGFYAFTHTFHYCVVLGVWSVISTIMFAVVMWLVGWDIFKTCTTR